MAGENSVITHHRTKGDTRQPWVIQLLRPDGSVVDLSGGGITTKYRSITLPAGAVKQVATDTGITVTDAANGKLTYDFAATDVDTEGTFAMFIEVTTDGTGDRETFPVDGRKRILKVEDPNTEALP